jgi:hypothetical protein
MAITPITDHKQRALDRLIEQYRDKPVIASIIGVFADQVQELEDIIQTLCTERTVAAADGETLDLLGDLVGIARQGFDDEFYRILIFVKIGQNVSQGEPERAISILKLLTNATLIEYINIGNAEVSLGHDGVMPTADVQFVYDNMQLVVAAGVRVDYIVCFDPLIPFAFDDPQVIGLGFDDGTDTVGGKFAFVHEQTAPFAFEGVDVSGKGFGDLLDPLVGGVFE